LVNMDLEPFVIASSLRLIVAQRLVRRLCTKCRRPMARDASLPVVLRSMVDQIDRLRPRAGIYGAAGRAACGATGYPGRTGIFEVLPVTAAIEELILARATASEVRAKARSEGMRTLRDAGLQKVLGGETSLIEVLEQTIGDDQTSASEVREPAAPVRA